MNLLLPTCTPCPATVCAPPSSSSRPRSGRTWFVAAARRPQLRMPWCPNHRRGEPAARKQQEKKGRAHDRVHRTPSCLPVVSSAVRVH